MQWRCPLGPAISGIIVISASLVWRVACCVFEVRIRRRSVPPFLTVHRLPGKTKYPLQEKPVFPFIWTRLSLGAKRSFVHPFSKPHTDRGKTVAMYGLRTTCCGYGSHSLIWFFQAYRRSYTMVPSSTRITNLRAPLAIFGEDVVVTSGRPDDPLSNINGDGSVLGKHTF